MRKYYFVLFIGLLLVSCAPKSITGLWLIEKVEVGEEEMTPVARWVRFHEDGKQESGNGWFQHSVGTYTLDKESNELEIDNKNGIEAVNAPFTVDLKSDEMTWKRTEGGQEVTVFLARIETLPASPGNQLLGLWKLQKATREGGEVTKEFAPKGDRTLFIRWDRRFVIRNAPEGRQDGVYRVHGHKSELEQTFFGDECVRKYWDFEVTDNQLILQSVNTENKITLEYVRIKQ